MNSLNKARKTGSTYASVGVNRSARERLRKRLSEGLLKNSLNYAGGNPIPLPFGLVFSSSPNSEIFVDFQIEVVGTKTLLAELEPRGYSSIGIDGVAMVVNDVIRSGARPTFLSDGINIAKSSPDIVRKILAGIMKGAQASGAVLTSGETGDAAELLHSRVGPSGSEPFDLFVACCGFGERSRLIMGGVQDGDSIIGAESSGIHSNGITLARKVLLRKWGGKYFPHDVPEALDSSLIDELLKPTVIYSRAVQEISESLGIKAAIHITGDGFAKFHRLANFNRRIPNSPYRHYGPGFEFHDFGEIKPIFKLIYETARERGTPISLKEMFQTFNMGFGFAVIVGREDTESALDLFNKYHPTKVIGQVNSTGRVKISGIEGVDTPVIL